MMPAWGALCVQERRSLLPITVFGDRLVSIAEANALNVIEVKAEWGAHIEAQAIKDTLSRNPDAKMVAVVHSETSTTILNPIDEIGKVVKESGAVFMVDAVSSLGGVPYDTDAWGIDLCASATQKCLGALPGLAPISVSPKAWTLIDRPGEMGHGWYTNLRTWRKYAKEWGDWHPTPVTMPVNLVRITCVTKLIAEGIHRMARYQSPPCACVMIKRSRHASVYPMILNPVLTGLSPKGIVAAYRRLFVERTPNTDFWRVGTS